METKTWQSLGLVASVTLTLTDQNLRRSPRGFPEVRKKDFQDFWNRFRKHARKSARPSLQNATPETRRILENVVVRYVAVGEYGNSTLRPHYHVLVFGLPPEEIKRYAEKAWPYGRVAVDRIRWDSPKDKERQLRYICKHMTDRIGSLEEEQGKLKDRQKEFMLASKKPPIGSLSISYQRLLSNYTKGGGDRLVAETGDVGKAVRIDGKIYPLSDWQLNKLREDLSIPKLARDRIPRENQEPTAEDRAYGLRVEGEIRRMLQAKRGKL